MCCSYTDSNPKLLPRQEYLGTVYKIIYELLRSLNFVAHFSVSRLRPKPAPPRSFVGYFGAMPQLAARFVGKGHLPRGEDAPMPARSAAFGAIDARMPKPFTVLDSHSGVVSPSPGLLITRHSYRNEPASIGVGHPQAGGAVAFSWWQVQASRFFWKGWRALRFGVLDERLPNRETELYWVPPLIPHTGKPILCCRGEPSWGGGASESTRFRALLTSLRSSGRRF